MTIDIPEFRGARIVLRRPAPEDLETRLELGRHKEIVEAYGSTADPAAAFTRNHAEAAIHFIERQDHAWVIDAGRFIGHVRLHGFSQQDKRAALAIGIDDPYCLGNARAARLFCRRRAAKKSADRGLCVAVFRSGSQRTLIPSLQRE